MPLHLGEHVIIVERAAHRLEFPNGRDTLLSVAIFGSDEESSATDELVVAFVDHAAGAVAVKEVDSKVKSLGKQLESVVGLQEEVEQIWSHEPLDLRLNLN